MSIDQIQPAKATDQPTTALSPQAPDLLKEWNTLALESFRVTAPVPFFMVIAHDVFDRIGKVHSPKNIATDGRMDFHFGEFRLRKFTWLIENVFWDRELSDIMQQRASEQRLQLRFSKPKELSHLCGIDLSSTHVPMGRLIFSVDSDSQRLNGIHVNVGHFLYMLATYGLGSLDVFQAAFIESIEKMDERSYQDRKSVV